MESSPSGPPPLPLPPPVDVAPGGPPPLPVSPSRPFHAVSEPTGADQVGKGVVRALEEDRGLGFRAVLVLVGAGVLAALGWWASRTDFSAWRQRPPAPEECYDVVDLETLGGSFSSGSVVNAAGWVTGDSALTGDALVAVFLYRDGQMRTLAREMHLSPTAQPRGYATNARGQIAGTVRAEGRDRAFLLDGRDGTVRFYDLPSNLRPESVDALSDEGQILGSATPPVDPGPGPHPYRSVQFLCRIGQEWEALADPNAWFGALSPDGKFLAGRNPRGQVLLRHADGRTENLGDLDGHPCSVRACAPGGLVTGTVELTSPARGQGRPHAFFGRTGGLRDLGTLGGRESLGLGVNARGEVVGSSTTRDGSKRAFVYRGGRMQDLTRLVLPAGRWKLLEARSINERGQITGYGQIDGQMHAYLLTPRGEPGPR